MRAALIALSVLAAGAPAMAQPAQPPAALAEGQALLTVTAEGEARARPDLATITVGVFREAATATEAMAQNAQAMDGLLQALRRSGVADRDIQTTRISLEPQYRYQENAPPALTGYRAVNQVLVTARQVDRLGRTLDAVTTAGGNEIQGIAFGFAEPKPLLNQARRDAVREARARAELYAEAAGLRLVRIVSIQEGADTSFPPQPMPVARLTVQESAATPVEPGESRLSATVTVVFALQ